MAKCGYTPSRASSKAMFMMMLKAAITPDRGYIAALRNSIQSSYYRT